jgi:hypothetical protein
MWVKREWSPNEMGVLSCWLFDAFFLFCLSSCRRLNNTLFSFLCLVANTTSKMCNVWCYPMSMARFILENSQMSFKQTKKVPSNMSIWFTNQIKSILTQLSIFNIIKNDETFNLLFNFMINQFINCWLQMSNIKYLLFSECFLIFSYTTQHSKNHKVIKRDDE